MAELCSPAKFDSFLSTSDFATGKRKAQADFTWYLDGFACSPDGRWLIANASGRDHQVQLRSGQTLGLNRILLNYDRSIELWGAAFSPDGKFAATCDRIKSFAFGIWKRNPSPPCCRSRQ